jgi:hypothetical protein
VLLGIPAADSPQNRTSPQPPVLARLGQHVPREVVAQLGERHATADVAQCEGVGEHHGSRAVGAVALITPPETASGWFG